MQLKSYQAIVDGQLVHSGHAYRVLADTYGTPLYIIDEESFRARIRSLQAAIQNPYFQTEILYASKALLTHAIAGVIAEMGIGQDVVSAGEIYLGLKAGIAPAKMYFHGNNKLDSELSYALEEGVGTIVIDNRQEAERLNQLALEQKRRPRVLLRLNPGVEAHTHEFIQTATLDSKFGESINDPDILSILAEIIQLEALDFVGFHSHIGSQVFDERSFLKAADTLLEFAKRAEANTSLQLQEINFGGGFGVYYSQGDQPFDLTEFLPSFMAHLQQKSQELGIQLQKVTIEPGRSLINDSGSTLYTIGDTKETLGGKHYAFVDGSMNDNIRPALYQAIYEAAAVEKMSEGNEEIYTIAGKACESGDKIIEDISLPKLQRGDLLLVNGTGAYNYSMASNYNMLPIPAMIHINQAKIRATIKRQSPEDIIQNQII